MNILLVHQYFLGKNQGGGARFNEMTKIWANEGHSITVISEMLYLSKKVDPRYKNKLFFRRKGILPKNGRHIVVMFQKNTIQVF